ncbi:acyl-ACP--UDP-N-acetylglucosamine O-acyltransferase [Nitrospina watsonii]|uniref:UDP-N-acetylglucosamine acyltransferase n=1 Tax=Nitrospina watsonii TaxID=1323948 RepID=A0ABM9HAM5_9BACT|nr:acyl-ACP--UDP-N-acetylglucosamine O-acyltransferase [Nitrospina watsonii]CAI2717187.1 UDP-N-acetylglucosamine acyltransferase [Nitrospina watsonii]
MTIAHTAIIDPAAQLGPNVQVGHYSLIGSNVTIGEGTEIGPHVLIEPGTTIGGNCRIFQGAQIGGEPQITGFKRDMPTTTRIGDNTVIREYVTIHRSGIENEATTVGSHCMLMGYAHVAHDCHIGNHVVVVNYAGLSGHIVVEDFAFISGQVGIHQHVRVGTCAMVGGMSGVNQDVLPYTTVAGNPAGLVGLNAVGLRRRDIKPEVRTAVKTAIKLIRSPEWNTTQVIEKIEAEIEMHPEIRYLIDFMKNSKRGFID